MKTLIIEDENLTAKRLESLINKYDPTIKVMDILASVEESVKWLGENESPDLIFMDIHLEDDLVFKIFEEIELHAPVIFTTAYDEYMIQAFKVNSIDYLLKPINYEELVQALEKFKSLKKQFTQNNIETLMQLFGQKNTSFKTRFMISIGTRIRSVEVQDIAYFYSEDKLSFLITKEGQNLPIDYSLDKLSTQLNPKDFFRINRQYLVGFHAIDTVYTHFKGKLKLDLKPKNKSEVFVSGDRMTHFKEWLGR